jgi:hypothetical protein
MLGLRLAASVTLIVSLTACGKPKSIQQASPAVREVNVTGPNINIRVEQDSRVTENSTINEVGRIVEDVARALKDGVPGPTSETKRVVFDVRFGKPAKSGDFAPDRFGTISFPLEALKSFEPSGQSAMNLAESYELGSGQSAEDGVKSCLEGSSFVANSRGFCRLAIVAASRDGRR